MAGVTKREPEKDRSGCAPMHTLGDPVRIDQIMEICQKYQIPVVEDAARRWAVFTRGNMLAHLGIWAF